MTTYQYTTSEAFLPVLEEAIRNNENIVSSDLEYTVYDGRSQTVKITFDGELTEDEEIELESIVQNHTTPDPIRYDELIYTRYPRNGPKQRDRWYEDIERTKLVREILYTPNENRCNQEVHNTYYSDGTLKESITYKWWTDKSTNEKIKQKVVE